jgi:hypothetical protein
MMFRKTLGTLFVLLLATVSASAQSGSLPPRDAINLSQATVYNSPQDIASWPVTTAITRLEIHPSKTPNEGVSVVFEAQNRWPNHTTGPIDGLQYTIWAVVQVNGQWYTSGFIEMWKGRPNTGAAILSGFANLWAYDARWGPMNHHQPQVGEQMGFFVSAGDARGQPVANSVRERSNVVVVPLPAGDEGVFTYTYPTRRPTSMDFDGDGRSDLGVYRPSTGTGYFRLSGGTIAVYGGGLSDDIPVPADYDGDGTTDVAVFRPSTGFWFIQSSSTGTRTSLQWGLPGDVPVPRDYDGDGKADIAVFRPSTGMWYVLQSSTGTPAFYQWGLPGDVPVPADYDGDGKTDLAVFRPSNGIWYIVYSSTGTRASIQWGLTGDVPVPGDYDGDGRTDIAVFRPATGIWYIVNSSTGTAAFVQWGLTGDVPMVGDYDGDGKDDIAVFRPASAIWYVLNSSTRTPAFYQWGLTGDIPILR